MSRIVILDGYTLNPGDLNWAALEALGPVTVHERTPAGEVAARAAGAGIILTNKALLPAEVIHALPDLRYIGVLATGVNVVDIAAARARGITVTNVPGYSTPSVAQHVFALLLEICQHAGRHADSVSAGDWAACPDFCYALTPLTELSGLTLGIIGYGAIGRQVARIGEAFGMKVIAAVRTPRPAEPGVTFRSMDEVFAGADVVTLHCPLTPDTEDLVNATRLAQMKRGAILLNTGRGPLIVEADLAAALHSGHLGAAGLDVLRREPPAPDNPLISAPRCLITPHIAWATAASRERLLAIAVANIKAWRAGAPVNVVS